MSGRVRSIIFALVCLAQLAVPVSLVVKHEQTQASGSPWRFQTAPVDPGDPFRGRYVRLSFAAERAPVPLADAGSGYLAHDRRVYAELAAGSDGFARLVRVHEKRPEGVAYADVFVQQMWPRDRDEPLSMPSVQVRLPFNRYYLPEAQAPAVEREYMEASRTAQANTYAEVRVRDGHAALVGLVLDGKPVQAGRR